MKIGIIGGGKVGCGLAIALQVKGYDMTGVYSKSEESANYLNNKLKLSLRNELKEVVINSEIIFITTSDKEIRNIAELIIEEVSKKHIANKIFFHCSGALSSEELSTLSLHGAFTGSFHPIQTFADKETGWKGLKNIYFGFEGSNEAKKYAEEIAKALDCSLLVIERDAKVLYHTAACILSNYMVTLFYMAEGLFEKLGIDKEIAIKAYAPLIEKTFINIEKFGSVNSLTGPISRGDDGIIEKHIKELEVHSPELLNLYKMLGSKTLEAAQEKGDIETEAFERLAKLFRVE